VSDNPDLPWAISVGPENSIMYSTFPIRRRNRQTRPWWAGPGALVESGCAFATASGPRIRIGRRGTKLTHITERQPDARTARITHGPSPTVLRLTPIR